jgi:hypothetical protein
MVHLTVAESFFTIEAYERSSGLQERGRSISNRGLYNLRYGTTFAIFSTQKLPVSISLARSFPVWLRRR